LSAQDHEPKYAKLSDQQKWEWHAEVCAFRHVVLDHPIDEASPCDPRKEWYSEALVVAVVSRRLAKREAGKRQRTAADHSAMLEGRAAINEWARRRGHADIDAYALAHRIDWLTAYGIGMAEIVAETVAAKTMKEPRHTRQPLDDIRRDLGLPLTDTKPRKTWTAEEMAAGRRALGLAPAEDGAAA
jgi:hypothetical protein